MPVEAVARELASYIEAFERTPHDEEQHQAFEHFLRQGFPNSWQENWKFTNLAPLARIPFSPAVARTLEDAAGFLGSLPEGSDRLVFVNGKHVSGDMRWPTSHVGAYARPEDDPFVALNAAFMSDVASDVAFVDIDFLDGDAGVADRPIHVIHISLPGSAPQVSHPRNLFLFGENSHATVIETYIGDGVYFTNAVTEIVVGQGAVIEHVKVQNESLDAFHISTVQVYQSPDSVFTSRSFAFGGALARTEINARLEKGSECTLNGLYLVDGKRHVDTRTTIDHVKPNATSHELYKGILDGHSSAVFNGKIIVRKDAQKTDAKQTNKNLVLSEDATINTKPQLEIFADDVRCTHGATVGQLDAESIFYLRSRGIGVEDARRMLIEAFAREIIDGVKIDELREYLGRFL